MNPLSYIRKIPGIVYIIAILIIVGSLLSPYFLTFSNFSKILYQSTILLIIASGMTLVISIGEMDLSSGAVLSLASMVTALTMEKGFNFVIAALAGLVTGLICGIVNAFFIVKAKVPSFLATFGMMNMAEGISLGMRDGATIRGLTPEFVNFFDGSLGPFPVVVVISILVFIIVGIFIHFGKLGPYLSSIGVDREAASYSGINVDLFRSLPYVILGLLAGIAGVIFTARLNLGHPTGGIGYEFEAVAAVVVGGNALSGGKSNIISTLLGVCALSILNNSLTMLGYPVWWQLAISGTVLIIALLGPNLVKYQLAGLFQIGEKRQ